MRKFKYILLTILCIIPTILIIIGLIGTLNYQDIDKLPLFYAMCFVIGIPFEVIGIVSLSFNLLADY